MARQPFHDIRGNDQVRRPSRLDVPRQFDILHRIGRRPNLLASHRAARDGIVAGGQGVEVHRRGEFDPHILVVAKVDHVGLRLDVNVDSPQGEEIIDATRRVEARTDNLAYIGNLFGDFLRFGFGELADRDISARVQGRRGVVFGCPPKAV